MDSEFGYRYGVRESSFAMTGTNRIVKNVVLPPTPTSAKDGGGGGSERNNNQSEYVGYEDLEIHSSRRYIASVTSISLAF